MHKHVRLAPFLELETTANMFKNSGQWREAKHVFRWYWMTEHCSQIITRVFYGIFEEQKTLKI